ncbi:NAD(P)H-binding protein [Frigoribacterium sp. CFBP9039]|uniref:SDR family oxidoreductase n=1 Tax=Frigoribacterium TaxID=96492 RepID=UPI00177C9656|nr:MULTISPECIES: NAD(P)H-binding protein [Frigoribacterium]MBD8703836.1 NAD(P)H-binding protein [Frigoribacterium sp. CFBP 13712]MCJ0700592.1 NAD(P)H-binding protein [Frigoribacterium faeni]MDY0946304.1 NAD(P)H-binding protein [Frigoribacterium sp. CFBP9039]
MTYLIHGATGAQGSPVAAALTKSGASVAAAVRDPSTYSGDGTAVAVDLTSVASLAAAYEGVDGVFVHLPIGTNEQQLAHARNIVAAVDRARPGRVVVSTSGYPTEDDGSGANPVAALIDGLTATGVSVAIVAPRLFLENLLLPPVTAGVEKDGVLRYPIRQDYAVSWSSHLDVADVAARLLTDASVVGVVGVGALPGLVGADLAAGFAAQSGRAVQFESQEPDDFGSLIEPLFGKAGSDPVVDSYRWRATQESELIDPATSAQERLGLSPRSVEQWLVDLQG